MTFVSYLWGIETPPFHSHISCGFPVCILPMRDWNTHLVCLVVFLSLVCILPMRDWNDIYYGDIDELRTRFVSYLWGIETANEMRFVLPLPEFVSYLWGIETLLFRRRRWSPFFRLYLTYEGLKQTKTGGTRVLHTGGFVSYLWGIETGRSGTGKTTLSAFVSYLWGIETTVDGTRERDMATVCILPMRDWNKTILYHPEIIKKVCILPMRDWNT